MSTASSATESDRRIDIRVSARDLINIGIFGALYIVTVFAINLLGFINPLAILIALAASIIAGACRSCCSSPGCDTRAWS